jgi:hypothetical protein
MESDSDPLPEEDSERESPCNDPQTDSVTVNTIASTNYMESDSDPLPEEETETDHDHDATALLVASAVGSDSEFILESASDRYNTYSASSNYDSDSDFESKSIDDATEPCVRAQTKLSSSTTSARKRKGGPGRPRAEPGSAADNPRNAQRRRRARQKKIEDQLEREWRVAVALGENKKAQDLYQQLLPTVRGRHLFPSKTISNLKAVKKLGENIAELNKDLGTRSKHRQDIAMRVTSGLPPMFCQEVLGFKIVPEKSSEASS